MRTTLDIDDDVLQATKELARNRKKTAGQMVSELLRMALTAGVQRSQQVQETQSTYGIQPFPSRGGVVSSQLVDDLQDELGI